MRFSVIIFFVGLLSAGCGHKAVDITEPLLKKYNDQDVAKYAISAVTTQPSDIISVDRKDDLLLVSYVRKVDGKRCNYKVKLEGDKVIWGNYDGRWRDDVEEGRISFVETGDSLRIIQVFDGDSAVFKNFYKKIDNAGV